LESRFRHTSSGTYVRNHFLMQIQETPKLLEEYSDTTTSVPLPGITAQSVCPKRLRDGTERGPKSGTAMKSLRRGKTKQGRVEMFVRAKSLRIENWPESDRSRWLGLWDKRASVLDDVGSTRRWRPKTIRGVKSSYSHWLGWLLMRDELGPHATPGERLSAPTLQAYVTYLRSAFSSHTVWTRVLQLKMAINALEPSTDLHLLKSALKAVGCPTSERPKMPRLRESGALEALGFKLMERAERGEFLPRGTPADLYRDGLQIALLAARPLRMMNFAEIHLGKNLIRRTDGSLWLHFDGSDVKNHKPIDVPFPASLVPNLMRYLEVFRPILLGSAKACGALWISKRGTQQARCVTAKRVCFREFGHSTTPHLFRDCAATTVSLHVPKKVALVHALLGNNYSTTEQHYNQARSIEAGRVYGQFLEKLARRRSGSSP